MKRDSKGRFLSKKDIEILELKSAAEAARRQIENLRRENDETADQVRAFLDKAGAVTLRGVAEPWGERGQRYRLVVEINETLIHRSFEWGNDRHIVDMIGQQLGRQAAREIALLNMKRY